MSTRRQAWVLGFACAVLAACSFDQGAHPDACTATTDCEDGYRCDAQFCVPSSGGGTGATGGSAGGGGASGSAGSGGSGGVGTDAGGADTGAMPDLDAATADSGGSSAIDATVPDAGNVDSGPQPTLYTHCSSPSDCTGPDEDCLSPVGGDSYCAPHCTKDKDCPVPADGTATVACSSNGDCSLLCIGGATCPGSLTCDPLLMLCH